MNKVARQLKKILEYVWLTTAIISLGFAVYDSIINSIQNAIPFYAFFFVGLFFYSTRRNQRLKNE